MNSTVTNLQAPSAHDHGISLVSMKELRTWEPAFDILPLPEAMRRNCLLFRLPDSNFTLVILDPEQDRILDWAGYRFPFNIDFAIAAQDDLRAAMAMHEVGQRALDNVEIQTLGQDSDTNVEALSLKDIAADGSPAVRLVQSTLYDALKSEASDIHLESDALGLSIKYRIDGVLVRVGQIQDKMLAEYAVSRIKVMSSLDIAEKRVPQDGRFKVSMQGREIDFRVSIMPGIHGEDAVLRILDKQTLTTAGNVLSLEALGFDPELISRIRQLSEAPYGLFLVTGPTGSGKTTTLNATITEVNRGHEKIITIEDPVEYQLPGILQIPVNERKGLTFAKGLRSILRHDPDKIMVGEIRDLETAQIAVQSALTGHQVFSTVHANNAFDVIGRLVHMGIDPYNFAYALNGVLAQRLIRINCHECAEESVVPKDLLQKSGLGASAESGIVFRQGKGCGKCHGTGYRGRKAIAELVMLTEEMREGIIRRAPARELREAAAHGGTVLLRAAAIELLRKGETSLEEVNRVTLSL